MPVTTEPSPHNSVRQGVSSPPVLKLKTRFRLRGWLILLIAAALLALSPLTSLIRYALHSDAETLNHVLHYLLPNALWETLSLTLGVGFLSVVFGVTAALIVSRLNFFGRRFFEGALVLPLAMPTYVLAFVYVGLLEYAGPLQSSLRDWGFSHSLPSVRSYLGAVIILSLTLYPYVYVLARSAFLNQNASLIEAVRSLGGSQKTFLWRVSLPAASPAIFAGFSLVVMETMADFGAVSILSRQTLTVSVYDTWYSMFNLPVASFISVVFVVAVFFILWALEKLNPNEKQSENLEVGRPIPRKQLNWRGNLLVITVLSLFLLLAFGMPIFQLGVWAWKEAAHERFLELGGYLRSTLVLAGLGAMVIVGIAWIHNLALRDLRRNPFTPLLRRIALIGYAFPGTVLAVGVFVFLSLVDRNLGLANRLSSTLITVLVGYLIRFLAVGHKPLAEGFRQLPAHLDEAGQSLGAGLFNRVRRIHIPLLLPSAGAALLLVFVDIAKELPMTLMTRPVGWDTLAVRIYQMTSEGEWSRAALPSLVLLAIGFFPAMHLLKRLDRIQRSKEHNGRASKNMRGSAQ